MGLDAAVRCRCWEDGKITSPPPFAEHIELSEDGWLTLKLDWQNNRDKFKVLDDWLKVCCSHCDMRQVSEHISNWGGYRLFQQQIRTFGVEQFPVLTGTLPSGNGGQTPADKAAACLAELDNFERRDFGAATVLIDADSGNEMHRYIESYEGVFMLGPDGKAGVDQQGYFVMHKKKTFGMQIATLLRGMEKRRGKRKSIGGTEFVVYKTNALPSRLANWLAKDVPESEVFRSSRFTQEQLGEKRFRLIDERNGKAMITSFGVSISRPATDMSDESKTVYPKHLAVEQRPMKSDEFEYILRPLRRVFHASVETGNPVCWL